MIAPKNSFPGGRLLRPGVWELRFSLGPDPVLRVGEPPNERPVYRRRSVTFKGTKTEARAEWARLKDETRPATIKKTDITFETLFRKWLATADLARSTVQAHEMLYNRHIRPVFGPMKLRDVTTDRIEDLYTHLFLPKDEGGAGLAASSIRRLHAVIDGALKRAMAWEWLDRNPAAHAKPPRVYGRGEAHAPTIPELHRAFDAAAQIVAEGGDRAAYAFVRTAAGTGMRRGELCGLQWDDIDGRAKVIHVRRSVVDVGGHVSVKAPKTGYGRKVAIPLWLVNDLFEYEKVARERSPWLWSSSGERVRPDKLTDLWGMIRDRAELSPTYRLHDLRHAYGTNAMELGGEVMLLGTSGNLGHRDSSTTLRIYSHSGADGQRMVAEAYGEELNRRPPSPSVASE